MPCLGYISSAPSASLETTSARLCCETGSGSLVLICRAEVGSAPTFALPRTEDIPEALSACPKSAISGLELVTTRNTAGHEPLVATGTLTS